MKKEKLKLKDLKVKSFVTSMEKQEKQTVDGGITPTAATPVSLLITILGCPVVSVTASIVKDTTAGVEDPAIPLCFTALNYYCYCTNGQ